MQRMRLSVLRQENTVIASTYLWTFYDYPQAELPNTNNSLEATFADCNYSPPINW